MANSANALNIKSAGIPVFDGTATFTESTTTQYNVLVGGTSNAIANVAPSATSGVPLISQGAASNPVFGTAVVAGGGTGQTTLTAHGVLIGNGTTAITQLAAAATGSTLMGSTGADPAFTGSPSFSGSVTAGTTITASSGAITATSGNVVITSGDLALTVSPSTSTTGAITQGGSAFVHNFAGTSNFFAGFQAGNFTMNAFFNTGIGNGALKALTTTANGLNTALGYISGTKITTGNENVLLGSETGDNLTTGNNNIIIGRLAGSGYTSSESNNILIGYQQNGVAAESNNLKIGTGTGTSAGQINVATICGITGKTSTSGIAVLVNSSNVLGTTTSSLRFKDNVQDMADQSSTIYQLRPVTFNYKIDNTHVSVEDSKLRQFGLIAEEVNQVIPDLVSHNQDGQIESVRYLNLIPMLLNEIQKLNKRIEQLEKKR